MGLDSVLAIAAAAKGSMTVMVIGLLIGIPLVLGGSKIFTRLLTKYPIIAYIGSGVLIHTAIDMMFKDQFLNKLIHINHHYVTIAAYGIAIVLMIFMFIKNKKNNSNEKPA